MVSADEALSIRRQCALLALSRSSLHVEAAVRPNAAERQLRERIDELRLHYPNYGSRRLVMLLRDEGIRVNRKRMVRLLRRDQPTA